MQATVNVRTSISNLESVILRRKFNVRFTTFWHLVWLAGKNREDERIRAAWLVTNNAAGVWKTHLSANDFNKFDRLMQFKLHFMDEKLTALPTKSFNEKGIIVLEKYEQCLEVVNAEYTLDDKKLNATAVCEQMVGWCNYGIENFKQLPFVWIHLFVSEISNLLSLAKILSCHDDHDHNRDNDLLDNLFVQHDLFVSKLREHLINYSSSINSQPNSNLVSAAPTNLVDSTDSTIAPKVTYSQLTEPAVPLDSLITTLNENVERFTNRIPVTVTSIINEYCFIDPFHLADAEFVKSKLLALQ